MVGEAFVVSAIGLVVISDIVDVVDVDAIVDVDVLVGVWAGMLGELVKV